MNSNGATREKKTLVFYCKNAFQRKTPKNSAWLILPSPRLDISKFENVQIRASKIPHEFGKLSYEERLKRMNIASLKDRRVRGDLIEMYKVIRS